MKSSSAQSMPSRRSDRETRVQDTGGHRNRHWSQIPNRMLASTRMKPSPKRKHVFGDAEAMVKARAVGPQTPQEILSRQVKSANATKVWETQLVAAEGSATPQRLGKLMHDVRLIWCRAPKPLRSNICLKIPRLPPGNETGLLGAACSCKPHFVRSTAQ